MFACRQTNVWLQANIPTEPLLPLKAYSILPQGILSCPSRRLLSVNDGAATPLFRRRRGVAAPSFTKARTFVSTRLDSVTYSQFRRSQRTRPFRRKICKHVFRCTWYI